MRILQYAMISEHPIIDPLSKKTSPLNRTRLEANRKKGSQIAIGFLATCKAFNVEGSRILWANNTFVFTTHVALQNFSNLALTYRRSIKHVNLRIIAQFYDDHKRDHILSQEYHPEMKRDLRLRVQQRPREDDFTRRGFRCYAWTQAVDFFNALRPPYDPDHDNKKLRPRLLPNLEAMRIDFVNFPVYFMPLPGRDFHAAVAHDLAATLNELMITGIPCCESGMKAGLDLSGMVKDGGLLMDGVPAFRQGVSNLQPLGGGFYGGFNVKVMRPWRGLTVVERFALAERLAAGDDIADEDNADDDNTDVGHDHHAHPPATDGPIPTCPEEIGHPESIYDLPHTTWKRVPVTRDSDKREWIEFDYAFGMPIELMMAMEGGDPDDLDMDEIPTCAKCGESNHTFDPDEGDL